LPTGIWRPNAWRGRLVRRWHAHLAIRHNTNANNPRYGLGEGIFFGVGFLIPGGDEAAAPDLAASATRDFVVTAPERMASTAAENRR
jgi:hypothetical protein